MALTVTEASAVNTLLNWLLRPGRLGIMRPTSLEAEDAAALLAEHANKTLLAGIMAADVRAAWPRLLEERDAKARQPKPGRKGRRA